MHIIWVAFTYGVAAGAFVVGAISSVIFLLGVLSVLRDML